jgi:Fe-S-cluster containining protein
MPKRRKTIPIHHNRSKSNGANRLQYDCTKCPGYCCSYPLIEVGRRDIVRLARHFGVSYEQAETRYTKYDRGEKVRALRQQKDRHYGRICLLFDTETRRCTVYEARPQVCRDYPEGRRCGYYEFLQFERDFQDDPDFVALTSNP